MMKMYLKDIPKIGCVKVVDDEDASWVLSRYELRPGCNLIVGLSESSTLLHLDDDKKTWHLDVKRYETWDNVRVTLTGTEVMLEPGTTAPNFRVRG